MRVKQQQNSLIAHLVLVFRQT